jgi:hypothetical protein
MATIKLETFGPGAYGSTSSSLFQAKLLNAVNTAPAGTVIDCTSYTGTLTLSSTVTIKKPLTLLFGKVTITFSTGNGKHMFHVLSSNVQIIGNSRSTATNSGDAGTVFKMPVSGAGYHVYAANTTSTGTVSASGLVLENIDFEGLRSTYTSVSNVATYTYAGSGGIVISEGNPEQSGSNVSNILLRNIHVNSAKHHGIMIFGAITSKLEKCRVRNTGGHGYYITGSSTSVHIDTCYALSTCLAGFCLHGISYSSLTTCAADNCAVGYWLRSTKGITLTSCGAEASIINASTLPYNLGITLWNSSGTTTINDIGSDNIGFFKGTSYLITGGEGNTLTSCYSKDPGNRATEDTYGHAKTSHFTIAGPARTNKISAPVVTGDSPLKYLFRVEDIGNDYPTFNFIEYLMYYVDTSDPEPANDPAMTSVGDLFNKGNTYLITFID